MMYEQKFGGVDKFLAFARMNKQKCDDVLEGRNGHHRPIQLGSKPSPTDRPIYVPLNAQTAIRIFSGNAETLHAYCFDFVNQAHQFIRTPSSVKIYMDLGDGERVEVRTMEDSIKLAEGSGGWYERAYAHAEREGTLDLDCETYLVQEGALLSIEQPDGTRSFRIPDRPRNAGFLTLQSEW